MEELLADDLVLQLNFHFECIQALMVRLLVEGQLTLKLVDNLVFLYHDELHLEEQLSLLLKVVVVAGGSPG